MSANPGRGVGRFVLGALGGAVVGLLLALPGSLAIANRQGGANPSDNPSIATVFACAGAIMGVVAGLGLVQFLTTTPGGRRFIASRTLIGAGVGCVFPLLLGVVGYNDSASLGKEFAESLAAAMGLAAVGLFWTFVCATIGLVVGVVRAGENERSRRARFVSAVERKFGPLDESRRAAIQTWDTDRLTEASRKLDGARRVEELDP